MNYYTLSALPMLLAVVLIVLFGGEPDIIDALIFQMTNGVFHICGAAS